MDPLTIARVSAWPVLFCYTSATALRISCTCANCQSEATGERLLDPKTVPEDITVTDMHLVGNYGVGVHFSDGHTTGIFRFRNLMRPR